jgi:uncharacterized membrane protein
MLKEISQMPDYEVNFYLSNGGKATLKVENLNGTADALEKEIQTQMQQSGDTFRITGTKVVISLKKNEIIGYSIDQL